MEQDHEFQYANMPQKGANTDSSYGHTNNLYADLGHYNMHPMMPNYMQEESLSDKSNNKTHVLTLDMQFGDGNRLAIIGYSVLMIIGGIGNITVLSWLVRRSTPKTRINSMLIHLAIADLLVIFLMMPLEIAWAATVQWLADDISCRVMLFFRIFGLYLSSCVLVSISVDRYYAVLKPLKLTGGERRVRLLLAGSWIASVIFSIPQAVIFHLDDHPHIANFTQCVSFDFFKSKTHELIYSMLIMLLMYGIPLVVIIFCYASILSEIIRRSRDTIDDNIRRSNIGFFDRARIRTLKMTITIVVVFFICWTPYYIMCLWYWFYPESAKQIDLRIQRGLFIFASANSCMNPLVYGIYNVRGRTQGSVQRTSTKKETLSNGEVIELSIRHKNKSIANVN